MRACAQRKTRPCRPDITAAAASVLYQLRSQANNLTDQVIAPLSVSTTVPSVTCRLPPTPHFLSTSFDPRSNGRRLAQIGPTSPPGPGSTRRWWSQVMAPPVPVLETDRRRRLVVSPALQTLLLGSGWFLGRFLGGEGGGEGGLVTYAVLPHRKIGQLAQTRSRGGAPPPCGEGCPSAPKAVGSCRRRNSAQPSLLQSSRTSLEPGRTRMGSGHGYAQYLFLS